MSGTGTAAAIFSFSLRKPSIQLLARGGGMPPPPSPGRPEERGCGNMAESLVIDARRLARLGRALNAAARRHVLLCAGPRAVVRPLFAAAPRTSGHRRALIPGSASKPRARRQPVPGRHAMAP